MFSTRISWIIVSCVTAVLFGAGCCSPPKLENPQNIVIVDPHGHMVNPQGKDADTWADNIFAPTNTVLKSKTNILIFFQGGLCDYCNGVDWANGLTTNILNDPSDSDSYYPIFFTWNSRLDSSWWDHWVRVWPNGAELKHKNPLPALYNTPADVCRLIGRIPITTLVTSRNFWRSLRQTLNTGISSQNTNISLALQFDSPSAAKACEDLASKGMSIHHQTNDETYLESFWWACEGALLAYPQLGGATIVDTGGKEGWDQMVRRTDTMFVKPLSPGQYQDGGAEIFTDKLIGFLATHTNDTVTLVAHSMGTIVANEIIRRHGPQLHIKNIVYMAAACGVQDFAKDVVPFLESNTNVNFYNLCLNPVNESSENHLELTFPINIPAEILAPHGSLLQWIDDYYSSADTTFGWTMGKLINVLPALQAQMIPTNIYHRITVTYFGVGPLLYCGPQQHGDFSSVRYWEHKFWTGDWSTNMAYQTVSPPATSSLATPRVRAIRAQTQE